ncbi:MAG: hypothetical protein INH37_06490, partial [Myxococcaceae bacterium]|nr:hypothetical protein [Myxococcaceae bacterium]
MLFALATAACLAAGPNPVVGRWQGGGFTLTLEASGAGTLSDGPGVPASPITWRSSAKALTITEEGEATTYAMTLKGDAMGLSGGDLDQPVTLRRVEGPQAAVTKAAPPKRGPPLSAKGSCRGACDHYVGCARLGPSEHRGCLAECAASELTPYQLAVFTSLDCQQAIAIVAAASAQAWQQVQGAAAQQQSSTSSECQGCV